MEITIHPRPSHEANIFKKGTFADSLPQKIAKTVISKISGEIEVIRLSARSWSSYTSKGQTVGDGLANCLYEATELYLPGHKIRKGLTDADPDLEENFTLHVEGIIHYINQIA